MKSINKLLLVLLVPFTLSCGDDDDHTAQAGLWLAKEDGVVRSGCDLESNDGPVSCPRTSSTTACVTLNLRQTDVYTLNVSLDGGATIAEAGEYEISSGKIKLCPYEIESDCYDVPVVDSDFDSMTIELNTESNSCKVRVEMEKV